MDYVMIRTHVMDHERFLEAGAVARDLWTWGMLWSGQHETDGELPMAAVLASPWGRGGRGNIRVAKKLVEVGLWERTDRGFRILRWAEQGNMTKAEMEARREAWRAKRRAQRASSHPPPPDLHPHESTANTSQCLHGTLRESLSGTLESVLNSPSLSSDPGSKREGVTVSDPPSGEGSGEGAPPTRAIPRLDAPLPPAFRSDAEAQVAPSGESVDVDGEWRKFVPHCIESAKSASASAWRLWVLRAIGYARRDRLRESDRKASAEQRRGVPPIPVKETPEQAKAFARELSRHLTEGLAEEAARLGERIKKGSAA